MVARSAPWPSSPAPSARREAALGLDRSARPSRLGSHAANGYLRCLAASKVRYRRVNADRLRAAKNVHDVWKRPLSSAASGAAGEGKRGAVSSYCFLLHTRPMILFTGAGRPVSGMYFVQATVWHLAMSAKPRLFPLVVRSRVLAGLAEWHGHTLCSHCENVPSKYLNGTMSSRCLKHDQHTVIPVPFCPPQPRHTVSVRALSSSSSSSSIRVRWFPIIRQGRHSPAVHLSV